jgi:hypothetical protein
MRGTLTVMSVFVLPTTTTLLTGRAGYVIDSVLSNVSPPISVARR